MKSLFVCLFFQSVKEIFLPWVYYPWCLWWAYQINQEYTYLIMMTTLSIPNLLTVTRVSQKFHNIFGNVKDNSAAEWFADVLKVTNHTELWDAGFAWYSRSVTLRIYFYDLEHMILQPDPTFLSHPLDHPFIKSAFAFRTTNILISSMMAPLKLSNLNTLHV